MLKNYLSTNSKLKRDGIFSFGIPAYKSATGMLTCPAALTCIKGCYARNGTYNFPSVKSAQEKRLELTKDRELFIAVIDTELRKRKVKILRIHDSGDFYSKAYLDTWLTIISLNPNIQFYAYTKMVPLFKGLKLPANFTVIYSEGGKYDKQIDTANDRHSRVFSDISELKQANYADTTTNDINAIGKNKRIGLVYHGVESKKWRTG